MISVTLGIVFLGISAAAWLWMRDLLAPAFVYSFAWGVVLTGIGLAEPYAYFQIGGAAAALFLSAAVAFLIGCAVVSGPANPWQESPALELNFVKLGWFCVALHLLMIPLAIVDIQRIVGNAADIFQVAFQLRIRSVTGDDSVGAPVGNYISAGLVFLPLLVIGVMTRKLSVWFAIALSLPWVLLGLFIGGRGGLITVILVSLYVYLSFGGRLGVKTIASFLLVFIVILVAGNLLVGKIDAALEDGVRDVALQSVKGFFDYFFAGPILFSKYMEDPTQIIPTWDALVFPCHVLEKFGLCTVPNIHQEFLSFSRDGDIGNVYSIVFSIFPKYGLLGLLALMFLYGLAASYFHRSRNDGIFPLLISGFLFYATALSIYLDAFAPSVYFFLKVYVITLVIKFAFTTPVTGGDNAGRLAA